MLTKKTALSSSDGSLHAEDVGKQSTDSIELLASDILLK